MAGKLKAADIAATIDHTVLKPQTTLDDVRKACREAKKYGFFGVCVPPYFVKDADPLLQDTEIRLISVIGFPLGFNFISAKVEEAKRAIEEGVDELDMVFNLSAFRSGDLQHVENDIQSVSTVCHMNNKVLKVIIETPLLTDPELKKICKLCAHAEVDYVKTATGTQGDATLKAVKLMRNVLPDTIRVKAAGGISDRQTARRMLESGASRLGTSKSVQIVDR